MKIITWNINSLRIRLELVKKLIKEENPDIICLQEIKVVDELFPFEIIKSLGYPYLYYAGQKSYNGVAIISKISSDNYFSLKFCNEDKRHIAINIKGLEIHNFYVPAGGDIPCIKENPKFKHKLEYIYSMQNWLTTNRILDNKLVLVGDFNIAPHEHDVWSSKQLKNTVSHTDVERTSLLTLQNSLNFIDSSRYFIPLDKKHYTWWSYRNNDWAKSNRGRRLDHIWVSNNLSNSMIKINTLTHARDWLLPSDHVPYMLELNYSKASS